MMAVMHDAVLENIRSASIERLGRHLKAKWGARPLDDEEKQALRYETIEPRTRCVIHRPTALDLRACWGIDVQIKLGEPVPVSVCVDGKYPFSLPKVFVDKARFFLHSPHVEASGKLCLMPDHTAFSTSELEAVVDQVLEDAATLLDRLVAGLCQSDFTDEFRSYWDYFVDAGSPSAVSILGIDTCAKSCHVLARDGSITFGPDDLTLRAWHNRRRAEVPKPSTGPAIVVEPPSPFLPTQYPSTLSDLRNLLSADVAERLTRFVETEAVHLKPIHVLLKVRGTLGTGLAACTYTPPHQLKGGFRVGHTPSGPAIAAAYYWKRPLRLLHVNRADADWIETRSGLSENSLVTKRVAIVGCGALGGGIATVLAHAGIRRLRLIDPDTLSWDNIGRHALGSHFVGHNKAEGLRRIIGFDLPHVEVEAITKKWQDVEQPFRDCDLVMSLTGSWSSDAALTLANRHRSIPIIYAWSEPFGCGGHSLAVLEGGGCLACGMDDSGKFACQIATFPTGSFPYRLLPACGASYTPHAHLEFLPINHMIATHALDVLSGRTRWSEHRYHVGPQRVFEEAGASLKALPPGCVSDVDAYGRDFAHHWTKAKGCQLCG